MTDFTLKVALEGRTSMSGLDHYELDRRITTLRDWMPNVDLSIEVDEVQSDVENRRDER